MKPKLYISAAIIAALLAIPITSALSKQNKQIKIEKTQNLQYKLRIEKFQSKTANLKHQIEVKDSEKLELQQKNADLEKQLQSKREVQAALAVAQAVTPPVAVYANMNCTSYTSLVSQYSWDVHVALAVMRAESGCNPVAASPACDHGLMQINCVHSAAVGGNLALLNDPATNIHVAWLVYAGAGGWSPWVAYTSGSYRKFL